MTPKERFIAALERKPLTGLVPHFELVFFLTMEAFGKLHTSQRVYDQWDQMSKTERKLHTREIAKLQTDVCERFGHSAIMFIPPRGWNDDDIRRCLDLIVETSGGKYAIAMHGDCTFSIPNGDNMMEFSLRMAEDPEGLKKQAAANCDYNARYSEKLRSWGNIDFLCLCSDYCFNANPYFSPAQFDDFITPYLAKTIKLQRDLGFHVVKHTDGNIMPILPNLVECNPHALHSIDPQGHVDIAEVKRIAGGKVALIGNVSCGALTTGTDADVEQSVRYALDNGMPGYGYIFSTSNCVHTGMPLERYELMLELWRKYGVYK